jgi:hypothetical protein
MWELSPAFDWRTLSATAADPAIKHRPTELSEVQREILRLHKQGLTPRDLATLFGLDDDAVCLLIYGTDEPGSGSV